MPDKNIDLPLSVIVPVGARYSDVAALYTDYKLGLDTLAIPYETIFVLDGAPPAVAASLQALTDRGEKITVVTLTREFGESTAIMVGFAEARGRLILTLPGYFQVDGREIGKLVRALETTDLAIGRRWPRRGNWLERLRRAAFHKLLAAVTRLKFNDLGCGARAMRRALLEEIQLYGDQHRFMAVLADRRGFRVKEIDLAQSRQDRFLGTYGAREYARGFLDIFTVFFLVRFTKKPLRFFGTVGVTTLGAGALLLAYLGFERLFAHTSLADRPLVLLASLLSVLGLQLFALGLLGELIIFTHARGMKDYQIAEIIEYPPGQAPARIVDRSTA